MQFDMQNLFSDQQSIAAAAGTVESTNVIDLGTTGTMALGGSPISDIGRGRHKELVVQVTEAVTSAGAATVQVKLVMSDNSDLSSPTVLMETAAVAKADLVPGYQFRIGTVPPGVSKRYLGLQYVIGTATTTAGKVTAGFVMDRQTNPTV